MRFLSYLLVAALFCGLSAHAAESSEAAHFHSQVQPILKEYCYDCHADGANKGGVAFDSFKDDESILTNRALWFTALKNLRAGLMPPYKKARPDAAQLKTILDWIKYDDFGIDPKNPDPGRVTLRRLNRVEYRNTIRDLMGVDFDTTEEFPADDTGYGFDDIGDVLTLSPMLFEKYLEAAKKIVTEAVPIAPRVIVERRIPGAEIATNGATGPLRISYYEHGTNSKTIHVKHGGHYQLTVNLTANEKFVNDKFDYNKCRFVFKVDGEELFRREFAREAAKHLQLDFTRQWQEGEHTLTFEVEPLTNEKQTRSLHLRIDSVHVRGPTEEKYQVAPKNYSRWFPHEAPRRASERRAYARELLGSFAAKAFRHSVDDATVDRLTRLAEKFYDQRGQTFEAGIAHAMIAVLASPQFLFREENVEPTHEAGAQRVNLETANERSFSLSPRDGRAGRESESGASNSLIESQVFTTSTSSPHPSPPLRGREGESPSEVRVALPRSAQTQPFIDEYSLASRLSYFLWSSMPDEELMQLAKEGQLRKTLPATVKRMMADPRSDALIENFTGQWLQARDIATVQIEEKDVLERDEGPDPEMVRLQTRLAQLRQTPKEQRTQAQHDEIVSIYNAIAGFQPRVQLGDNLRGSMRREVESYFRSIVQDDRNVIELVDSDYAFLNERLAKVYGLTNLNVSGSDMVRVSLPAGSSRGGVLTMGGVLVVTSNPTRTSPVKRGLFVLDNILGTPVPPPPANLPPLEDSEHNIAGHPPTLRETLAIHREKPMCASCHNRMDPLGLALENFNALGMWREHERDQPIDASGQLITGERFKNIRELKHILATQHRQDFYRTLTEKMLTYALGRGLEWYDVETVDQIVARLDRKNGRFSALLTGIIESAPFQKRRAYDMKRDAPASSEQRADRN